MTLSLQTKDSIERLIRSSHRFLEHLRLAQYQSDVAATAKWSDVFGNVQRYLGVLTACRSENDAQAALRGANLLTTVNKGVGDTEVSAEERLLAEQAFTVTRDAIEAARHLRADNGMDF